MNININLGRNMNNGNVVPQSTHVMKPWQAIIFGIIILLIGIGIVWYSIGAKASYNLKNLSYVETDATVVSYKNNTDGLQAIIVQYIVDGKVYENTSGTYSEFPQNIGSKVKIKYNKDAPADMIWVNDSSNILLPIVGSIFAVVGLIATVVNIKKMKNHEA